MDIMEFMVSSMLDMVVMVKQSSSKLNISSSRSSRRSLASSESTPSFKYTVKEVTTFALFIFRAVV